MRMIIRIAAILAALMMPAMAGAQQSSSSSSQASAQSTQSSQSSEKTAQAAAAAQVVTPKTESLAEAARKARAAEKNAPKAATVFTNDNLPTMSSGVSVVGQASAPSSTPAPATSASSASAGTSAGSSDEAAWRGKFANARHKIEQDKQELAIMQREMGELNVQYYANPTKALMQSISRSDITKKQAAIDAKQKQLAADEQALSDLQDQLRKAGGDPGWARE